MRRAVLFVLAASALVAGVLLSSASGASRSGSPGEQIRLPAGLPVLVFTSTRTGLAQAYEFDMALRALVQLTFPRKEALESPTTAVSVSPNGRRLLIVGPPDEILSLDGSRTSVPSLLDLGRFSVVTRLLARARVAVVHVGGEAARRDGAGRSDQSDRHGHRLGGGVVSPTAAGSRFSACRRARRPRGRVRHSRSSTSRVESCET